MMFCTIMVTVCVNLAASFLLHWTLSKMKRATEGWRVTIAVVSTCTQVRSNKNLLIFFLNTFKITKISFHLTKKYEWWLYMPFPLIANLQKCTLASCMVTEWNYIQYKSLLVMVKLVCLFCCDIILYHIQLYVLRGSWTAGWTINFAIKRYIYNALSLCHEPINETLFII